MQTTDNNRTNGTGRRRQVMQQGQTIVVALLVLLLLGFVGGLFASIVTRNLRNAGRSNRIQTADYYAEAGIRFANDQLMQSTDGADWRPPLQFQITDTNYRPKDKVGMARYVSYLAANPTFPSALANDPDATYLNQGFTRYNIGTGRFLLRLTYDPAGLNNLSQTTGGSDPRARYIKIEVVGREGTVDSTDPTTFTNAPPIRLAAPLVEYKAIGITDYARFETNPDKRADVMALGVASAQYVADFTDPTSPTLALSQYPLVTTYGAPDAYTATGTTPNQSLVPNPDAGSGATTNNVVPGGGSIQVNGSVRFYGQNFMYLNNNALNSGSFGENAAVAGNILLDNYNPSSTATTPAQDLISQSSGLAVNPPAAGIPTTDINPATNQSYYVAPSNAQTTFSTQGGLVRDGGSSTDAAGLPRNANRLEPPSLDTVNPATNLTRYKDIATNAAPRQYFDGSGPYVAGTPSAGTIPKTLGQLGYGRSIYIDNFGDMQSESTSIVGGHTLVDEWLHRTAAGQGQAYWVGSFYRPPGVDIVLGRQQIVSNGNVKSFYGVRMTRTDVDTSGAPVGWRNPNGTSITEPNVDGDTSSTMFVSYTSLDASNASDTVPTDATSAAYQNYAANPSNDVVIYAEGNVRVRGTVSAPVDPPSAGATPTPSDEGADIDKLPRHVTIVTNGTAYIDGSLLRGKKESSIAVLAHDYVCVNTTQFLAGAISDANTTGTTPPGPYTGDPSLQALDFSTSDEVLLQEFQYVTPVTASGTNPVDPSLYISVGPSSPGTTAIDLDIVDASTGFSLTTNSTDALFQPLPGAATFSSTGVGSSALTHTTYSLRGTARITQSDLTAGGDPYLLAVRRDPGTDQSAGVVTDVSQDLLLERAAVLPADIDIEAVLFAQNKSFFIIPGSSFNTSTDDNLTQFINGTLRPSLTGLVNDGTGNDEYGRRSRYPFYGQPIDMKIIIRGSVSEARPADIDAQTDWMLNWGWIPKAHGSRTDESSNRAAINVTTNQVSAPIGLTLLYNPLAGYPYMPDMTTPDNSSYLRTDIYGRPLPYAPKMPVCTGVLYAGQNTADQPLLQ